MQHVHWAEPGTVVTPPLRRLLVFFSSTKSYETKRVAKTRNIGLGELNPFVSTKQQVGNGN